LAAWELKKVDLSAIGCTVYGISVDNLHQAQSIVNDGITFPIAYGCTAADAKKIGAWWNNDRLNDGHIQPTEFLVRQGGLVLGSMYASGPIGRIDANEAASFIASREQHRS